jgi:cation transport protein ChaC
LVSKENACEVLNLLEIREKQYDKRVQIDLFDASDALIIQNALTYIATPDPANWNWLGEPRGGLPESAMQIATAIGPSGPNSEYLFNLCDAMRGIGVDDPHLYELEKAVREILRRKECI